MSFSTSQGLHRWSIPVWEGPAFDLMTQGANVRRYGVELDAERAMAASAKGIETIQGNAFDAIAKPESFSLLYLNPPYDSEIGPLATAAWSDCSWSTPSAGW